MSELPLHVMLDLDEGRRKYGCGRTEENCQVCLPGTAGSGSGDVCATGVTYWLFLAMHFPQALRAPTMNSRTCIVRCADNSKHEHVQLIKSMKGVREGVGAG